MKTIQALAIAAATALTLATTGAAWAGPMVGGDVTIKGNRAGKVVTSGAKGSVGLGPLKGGQIDSAAGTNVNSVVVKGGSISGKVTVMDNRAGDVYTSGAAQSNVNSLVVTK
jgi:hypothetical protein